MSRFLLLNDDGWDAPGLACLKQVAESFGECWTVAPTHPQSGTSHRLTLTRDLKLVEVQPNFFHLDGTPADCARIGLTQLDQEFDLVLAGVNDGANLGADIFVSGTIAAAREAWLFGKPAIAVSHYRSGLVEQNEPANWHCVANLVRSLLRRWQQGLLSPPQAPNPVKPATILNSESEYFHEPPRERYLLSVNLPHLETGNPRAHEHVQWVECPVDTNPLPLDYDCDADGQIAYRGKYSHRPRQAGHDIDVCFSGHAAISWLA